jgi:penicillin-binding protein 1A
MDHGTYDDDRTLLSPAAGHTHAAPPPQRRAGWKRALKWTFGIVFGLGVLAFAWLWFAPCGMGGCAPLTDLNGFQAEGSQLLDVHDKPFGSLSSINRRVVSIDSVPDYLPKAFLAVEDRRFYEHGGVDWKRFGGAILSDIRSRSGAEGGSTITMQLARNLFPKRLPYQERSIRRKFMEMRIARQIDRAFPKKKILELYINHIYLGEGAYGVDAAAQEYFGKPAAKLSLAEAALIGGLPKAPSQINPREDRDAALARRNLVLGQMAQAGYVTPAEAEAARAEPIRLARGEGATQRAGMEAWFVARVRRELEERVGDRFYTAGLRVHTSYDPEAQKAAQEELAKQLAEVEAGRFGAYRHPAYSPGKTTDEGGTTPYLQGMAIVMDAATGEVRALVGGRDFDDSKFDRAFQARRQPGSAFKPFVYLTALENGVAPNERVEDAPVTVTLSGGRTWTPRNYTGTYDGPITVRDALARSKNTVTVRLAQQVGMGAVAATARKLGITTDIPTVPSAALGAAEVRPVELVGAYAAFANGGRKVVPHLIRSVEDPAGGADWDGQTETEDAIDAGEAFVLTSMLRDVVDRGSGTAVRAAGFRGAAAGKTGTTNAATDVWFVGYTPEIVTGVWIGLDKPQTVVAGASGGTIAAPVWARIMSRVYAGRPQPRGWSQPGDVASAQADRLTGAVVDATCPAKGPTYTEYFLNSVPASTCNAGMLGGVMDTTFRDEEWGAVPMYDDTFSTAYPSGTGGIQPSDTMLPQLPPPPPLPAPPAGSDRGSGGFPRASDGGGRVFRDPVPPPPPAGEPLPPVDRAPPSPDVPRPRNRPPRVLGKPVEPSPAEPSNPPSAPPAPPDTTSPPPPP